MERFLHDKPSHNAPDSHVHTICHLPGKGMFTLLASVCLFFSCGPKQPPKMDQAPPPVEEQLYRTFTEAVISYKSDSFLAVLDTVLPGTYSKDYRTIAYRLFLNGYKEFKRERLDTAAAMFTRMLQNTDVDTARDYDLITLRQSALLRVQMYRGVNPNVFRLLLPILDLNEKYPSRYRWWAYNLAAQAWFMSGDITKAEQYLSRAEKAFPDTLDYGQRAQFMANHSRIETEKKNLGKALQYEDSAYNFARTAGDNKMIIISTAQKGLIYIRLGQAEKGLSLQLEAFDLMKKLKPSFMSSELIVRYLDFANTFHDEKQYGIALKYAREALALAEKNEDDGQAFNANSVISNIYRGLHEYDSAYDYLVAALNSQLRYERQVREKEIAALGLNYELKQQKQQTFQLASANKAKDAAIAQQRALIVAVGICLILSVLLAYVYIRQRRLRAAYEKVELVERLLRSQIEPHFIYNCLTGVQGLIRNYENPKAISYLNKFARLLRVSLENSRRPFVSLQQEVEALRNYLDLQEMRFGHLFDYSVFLYDGFEEDEHLQVPPMLIQPFVENAIHYGIQGLDGRGHIIINITKAEGTIHCSIEDNGRGMKTGTGSNSKKSLSTDIIRERLELLEKQAGRPAGVRIIDKASEGKGPGVVVLLDIPYILEEPHAVLDTIPQQS